MGLWTKRTQSDPYAALAEIYDFAMRHVNYGRWARYVHAVFERHGFHPKTVLDVACGTGTLALELSHSGYTMSGVDREEAMLAVARRKADRAHADIAFERRDMRSLDDLGPFDAVLCLYDSINYLCEQEEIATFFQNIRRILRADGPLVFDICTERNSLGYFRDSTERERGSGFSYTRNCRYDPEARIQFNHFQIRFDGKREVFEETHSQRIYRFAEMLELIEESPFELLAAYDGFSFRPGSEDANRIHFVLH